MEALFKNVRTTLDMIKIEHTLFALPFALIGALLAWQILRLRFPGRDVLFYAFLLQLMLVPPALIVPNLSTVVDLRLYDTLPGVMAPYFASAFASSAKSMRCPLPWKRTCIGEP